MIWEISEKLKKERLCGTQLYLPEQLLGPVLTPGGQFTSVQPRKPSWHPGLAARSQPHSHLSRHDCSPASTPWATVGCLWRPVFCLELKCSCGGEWGPTAHPQGLCSITLCDCHSTGGVPGPMEVLLPRALQGPTHGLDPGTLFPEQLLPGPRGKCVPVGPRWEE